MPGKKSLEMQEYYAYKYNTFWEIMFHLFETDYSSNYTDKINLLINNKIALWDSLKYCYRKNSADSEIKDEIPNDFDLFYEKHPAIKYVFFNGTAAMKFYKKYVGFSDKYQYFLLPSTSPANARMDFEKKLHKWQLILEKTYLNGKNFNKMV